METTIALGEANSRKVGLWCEITDENTDEIYFHVINGRWDGHFNLKTGVVTINGDTTGIYKSVLLWRGKVPEEYAYDYNTAIAWIDDFIGHRDLTFVDNKDTRLLDELNHNRKKERMVEFIKQTEGYTYKGPEKGLVWNKLFSNNTYGAFGVSKAVMEIIKTPPKYFLPEFPKTMVLFEECY